MKIHVAASCLLAVCATAAQAGGIDRSGQSVGILFEKGSYMELSFGHVQPSISGVGTAFSPTPEGASGDMAANFSQVGVAAKMVLNDHLDVALIMDQPFGANVSYPVLAPYFARGTTARLKTTALTGIIKYHTNSNVSVFGGLRYQTMSAKANVPFVAGYTVDGASDAGLGYLLGVAYEKPEIALRVALTYNSSIAHNLASVESSAFGTLASVTEINTPQSVNLEAQTGIAKDTLLYGSARWVDWSSFDISPAMYSNAPPAGLTGNPLVAYSSDTILYTLGVGRRFNDHWSSAVSVGYEKPSGGFSANLGPHDGRKSVTIGATYTKDAMKISGGISYIRIGKAETTLNGVYAASEFKDNSAVAFGLKVGFTF